MGWEAIGFEGFVYVGRDKLTQLRTTSSEENNHEKLKGCDVMFGD